MCLCPVLSASFDYKLYAHFLNQLKEGAAARKGHDAYSSYAYYPKGCVLWTVNL